VQQRLERVDLPSPLHLHAHREEVVFVFVLDDLGRPREFVEGNREAAGEQRVGGIPERFLIEDLKRHETVLRQRARHEQHRGLVRRAHLSRGGGQQADADQADDREADERLEQEEARSRGAAGDSVSGHEAVHSTDRP
jgi:hypothetical protein